MQILGKECSNRGIFAIHAILAQFKSWIEGYLSAEQNESVTLMEPLRDGNLHLEYVVSGVLISLRTIHKSAEDTEITVFIVGEKPEVEAHIQGLLAAIQERWVSSSLPYSFVNLIRDKALAEILKTRWEESIRTFEAKSYLSTLFLLGSILEGMLLYKVEQNPKQANQAKSAPKDRTGKVLPFIDSRWNLESLINVAYECKWLSYDTHHFCHLLQNYRNLIHPREYLKFSKGEIDAGVCKLSREIVQSTLEHLITK